MSSKYAYIAGIIDGEGYIGVTKWNTKNRKPFYKTRIIISNCNLDLLKHIQTIIPSRIEAKQRNKEHYNWTQGYNLVCRDMEKWLPKVIPYLFGKKKKAELALEATRLLKKRAYKTSEERHKRVEEINQLLRSKEWLI